MKHALHAVLAAVLVLLGACGGGGDDAGSGPNVALGQYNGSGGANRALKALVLESGRSYLIYGRGSSSVIPVGGVVVADLAVSGTAVESTRARDFSVESKVVSVATVSATSVPRVSLNGTLGVGSGAPSAFTLGYDRAFEDSPSLTHVGGAYVGEMAELSGSEPAALNIDASTGVVAGTTSAGCDVVGLVSTHGTGNVYEVSLSFQPGCIEAGRTLRGHAFRSGNQLYAVVVSSDLSRAVIWAGVKT